MGHSNMDHSEMDHSNMENPVMDKPLPNTKDQKEVKQQEFSNAVSDWHNQDIKGSDVKVAVLDTGIDKDNKDLIYVKGVNFVGDNKDNYDDDNGHGTKITGIIGARENDFNLLGIAPNSDLYIAKVADKNGAVQVENLIKGINWAINEDVQIINISLELPEDHKKLHTAIKKAHQKGIVVIASSGNIKFPGDKQLSYPGSYSEVINVGMLNIAGEIYSQEFEDKKVDVYAPGEDIFSLYLNDKMTLDTGVSYATAYTSGYAALLINNYQKQSEDYDIKKIKGELQNYLKPTK
ncbi:hypothetical protein BKP37_08700 [Anaerobacillus alkalilacustris]|uniref:Peptidase S8/S53 domain-containing protein n=1 Tax=Anaerobacillus alkalilacustris TaxID=393763 RepID=A0A1S2LPK0_9BACI|nr:S8 family serine peptidase [Anaerobacillus alkalilacustris]OIJ14411.1 hypothetical protein BKP37_08700 [Anaerobacillus alkalilacustris]